MAEKVKKKPSFFSLKRFNSQKSIDEPVTPTQPSPPALKPAQRRMSNTDTKPR
ncbi:hypothetical protein KGM_202929A, partial [Danaus plexippus plexippus]